MDRRSILAGLLNPSAAWYERAAQASRADLDNRGGTGPAPNSIGATVQDQFSMDPNADRPMMWPSPDRAVGGGVDWSSWTAPEWMYEGAKS